MNENTERPGYEPELTQPPTAAPTARYSSMQRLWMMFTSPGQVFEDISIKPTWILIMAILVILGVGAQIVIAPHIDNEATLRAQLADRADDLTDEQIENMVATGEKFAKFGPIFALVIAPFAWAIMVAVFLVMLKIVGSEIDFKKTLSTVLHGYWPASAVALVLTGILVQRVGKVPQQDLANIVKANIGAFMSPESPAWLTAAASTISVFNIWVVVLLIMGFATVGKLSRGKAAVAAVVPWIIWMVVRAGFAMFTG
ncbi:MAG: Yip1 family protein [Acidobacteriota bacterium]|nr:Yip1 family protein [Acidobacteriota bacterium]